MITALLFPISLFAQQKAEGERWKSSASVAYVTVSGNAESQTMSIAGDAHRKGENNELELKAGTVYGKSEGETISQYWYGNMVHPEFAYC